MDLFQIQFITGFNVVVLSIVGGVSVDSKAPLLVVGDVLVGNETSTVTLSIISRFVGSVSLFQRC